MSSENLPIVSGNNGDTLQIAEATRPMPEFEQQPSHSGMNLYDILFMLFRHKWKIISFALGGLLAAGAVYILVPPIYESDAKLFVRYVLDKSAVDLTDPQIKTPNPDRGDSVTGSVIGSEAEILTSRDLAQQVAEAVGIDKILPKAGANASLEKATDTLSRGLVVSTVKGTNIIELSFRSTDPKLPMPILQEWVKRYFDKHLEVHRSMGTFEFVTKEAEQLRLKLHQTEEELKRLKEKAGVISLKESRAALATQLGKAQEELDSGEAEAATQRSRVEALEKSLMLVDKDKPSATPQPISPSVIQKYQSLATQLTQLQQSETDLLSRYTAENRLVKIKSAQIAAIQKQRQDLEKKYPTLAGVAASAAGAEPAKPDIISERARLVGLQSRLQTLRARVNELQARAHLMEESSPRIEQLERQKDLEEASYKHSETSLEKARIDETLDPSRMPNISVVQTPSPVVQVGRDVKKFIMALAGGGIAAGLAIALMIELVLDRSVKRSRELEKRLQIPVLLSIPYLGLGGQRLRLRDSNDDSESAAVSVPREELVPNADGELLRPFCEAIRDRLGIFFELNGMRHKPKLVAVTSLGKDAGASTLAAGLVDAISETAEGKVLFVDKVPGTKRFYNMMADFQKRNLDYVVFDMPPVGDVSATVPMAGFMDTVLLVVEAEKSNRAAVKRAYAELSAKTKVSVVFNKSRSYGPKWLEAEI
jgi:succinoglycan biosynthesis transport protein ExoP